MATQITKNQFIEILLDREIITMNDLTFFQAIYSFEGHKAYASQVGRLLGYTGKRPQSPINLQVGRIAKRIAKKYELDFTIRANQKEKYWDLFFNGWEEGRFWVWQLKEALIEALIETSLTGEIQYSEELPTAYLEHLTEGMKRTIIVNSYERNPQARKICIEHWGTTCCICEFNFGAVYGQFGEGFIHVHHLTPISKIGKNYEIDPIKDLRPVCPNCHAILHKKSDTLSIEEVKNMIFETSQAKNQVL